MKKIVMLCSRGDSSCLVYNKLSEHFSIEKVIIEDSVSTKNLLKRRIKKLGFMTVLGQVLFVGFIVPFLKKSSVNRKKEILKEYGASVDDSAMMASEPVFVNSVNDKECIETLKKINPDIVIVNGTRIISEEVLNCVNAKFVNLHAGITPKYRGSHGAYWALYNKDKENAGVTVHFVDKGIDTGNIIYQSTISVTEKDNFTTYPLLQTCVGVEDEIRAINDIMNGEVVCKTVDLPSGLYSHPTIWQYLIKRIFDRVK